MFMKWNLHFASLIPSPCAIRKIPGFCATSRLSDGWNKFQHSTALCAQARKTKRGTPFDVPRFVPPWLT
jgi:hypothetical protein